MKRLPTDLQKIILTYCTYPSLNNWREHVALIDDKFWCQKAVALLGVNVETFNQTNLGARHRYLELEVFKGVYSCKKQKTLVPHAVYMAAKVSSGAYIPGGTGDSHLQLKRVLRILSKVSVFDMISAPIGKYLTSIVRIITIEDIKKYLFKSELIFNQKHLEKFFSNLLLFLTCLLKDNPNDFFTTHQPESTFTLDKIKRLIMAMAEFFADDPRVRAKFSLIFTDAIVTSNKVDLIEFASKNGFFAYTSCTRFLPQLMPRVMARIQSLGAMTLVGLAVDCVQKGQFECLFNIFKIRTDAPRPLITICAYMMFNNIWDDTLAKLLQLVVTHSRHRYYGRFQIYTEIFGELMHLPVHKPGAWKSFLQKSTNEGDLTYVRQFNLWLVDVVYAIAFRAEDKVTCDYINKKYIVKNKGQPTLHNRFAPFVSLAFVQKYLGDVNRSLDIMSPYRYTYNVETLKYLLGRYKCDIETPSLVPIEALPEPNPKLPILGELFIKYEYESTINYDLLRHYYNRHLTYAGERKSLKILIIEENAKFKRPSQRKDSCSWSSSSQSCPDQDSSSKSF